MDGVGVLGLPKDRMLALQRQSQAASAAAPVDTGLSLEKIRFRYSVSGSNPPWKRCAPSTMARRSISSSAGIAQGELPPLFVIGAQGDGQLVNYRFRSPYYIVDRLFGAAELRLAATRVTWCVSNARMAWRGGTDHEPGRHSRPRHAACGQGGTEAVALRAQPRPVTRLNRRTLAILVGGLSVAVLGALMWSLQPQRRGAGEQTELYNVDRVSKSEGLDALPADYSKLPPLGGIRAGVGAAAARRSWPGHCEVAAAGDGRLRGPRQRPQRRVAQGSRSSSGIGGVLPLWFRRPRRWRRHR